MSAGQTNVDALLDEMENYIRDSRGLLEAGQGARLSELAPMAARLDGAVRALSVAEHKAASNRIQAVIAQLATLEEDLRARQMEVVEELETIGRMRRAAQAYRPPKAS